MSERSVLPIHPCVVMEVALLLSDEMDRSVITDIDVVACGTERSLGAADAIGVDGRSAVLLVRRACPVDAQREAGRRDGHVSDRQVGRMYCIVS